MTAGHPQESQALGGLGRETVKPFTLHVSQTFANQGIAPSLAPLALSASLTAPQFSAASGGALLASTHSTLPPSYLRDPRRAPQPSAFPSFAGWSSAGLQSQLLNLV